MRTGENKDRIKRKAWEKEQRSNRERSEDRDKVCTGLWRG